MKTTEDLKEFFHCDLGAHLYELEEKRQSIAKKFWIMTISCILLALLACAVVLLMKYPPAVLIAVAIILILIALGWYFVFINTEKKTFVYEFKRKVIKSIVQFIDENLDYSPTKKVSQSTYMQSTLFKKTPDRYKGEDMVFGRIGNTNLKFSEIHSEYKTETRNSKGQKQTQWHTIFKGLFFVADFNRNFHGTTVILPDLAEKMFGFLGKTLQKWNLSRDELIKLEDPEFEKLFVVYGTDQIEARYLLTTTMMERLTEFHKKAKKSTGKNIFISFTGNKIFIAIACTKNLFEPRIFKSNNDFNLIREYFESMQLAVGIVEELNLNPQMQ